MTTPSATEPPPASEHPRETVQVFFPSPRQLLVLLAGYFVLQVFLRVVFSTSTDLDESEALVMTQRFSLGYGSDPPLYFWLQKLLFGVLGTSVFTLSLLKNFLLFSTYALTFATARLVTRSAMAAVAAALSVFFLPSIAWESQRDLTHSVLAATLSVATLFCFLNVQESKSIKWYVLLGLAAGCGCISKYNYVLWLVGLLSAGVLLKATRPALLNRRIFISTALVLVIFLPNALWMLDHRDLALLNSSKFEVKQSLSWLPTTALGVKNIAQSILSFTAPLTLIYLVVFLKRPARLDCAVWQKPGHARLLFTSWAIIGLLLLLLVFFAHATGFRERWFQPILITLPIAASALVQKRLDPFRLKVIASIALLVMLAVALAMPGRLLLAERLRREEPLTRPYARLAEALRPVIPADSLLLCDTEILAGNLRLGLGDATPLCLQVLPLFPQDHPHCFLIWDARRSDNLPDGLRKWAETNHPPLPSATQAGYLSERYRYHHAKQFRLGYLQLN